jgi:hypothetical protein
MKGDFSRISFDPSKHFSRVLLQQGRVTLDANPNEQSAILLHYVRALARDLIGPCGGPIDNLGFVLSADNSVTPAKLNISAGRYYVDGILCECDGTDYASQRDYPLKPASDGQAGDPLLAQLKTPNEQQGFWLYLDVWERHITWIEDDSIREVALNGVDTCTRAKVVWQVRAQTVEASIAALQKKKDAVDQQILKTTDPTELARLQAISTRLGDDITRLRGPATGQGNPCGAPLDGLDGRSNARMAARLDPGQQIKDPCSISPDAQYRGVENQLYRVEIHDSGTVGTATFKWSIDNGSVATAWLSTQGSDLLVTNVRGFASGNWVELSDDSNDLLGQPGVLVKLINVSPGKLTIDSNGPALQDVTKLSHPKVRRWDETENDVLDQDLEWSDGAILLVEASATDPGWISLKDGVQVQFEAGGDYRCGDYWLIPARVATGSIEWPHKTQPDGSVVWELRHPQGIEHHYASLGFLSWSANNGGFNVAVPCNCKLMPINSCAQFTGDVIGHNTIEQPGVHVVHHPTLVPAKTVVVKPKKKPK